MYYSTIVNTHRCSGSLSRHAPTNHYLTVTDRYDNQVRGKVVYLQPKKERWREDHVVVHIVTSDWLDPYRYPAMYKTPKQTVNGFFMAHKYESIEDERWLFKGTVERVGE